MPVGRVVSAVAVGDLIEDSSCVGVTLDRIQMKTVEVRILTYSFYLGVLVGAKAQRALDDESDACLDGSDHLVNR